MTAALETPKVTHLALMRDMRAGRVNRTSGGIVLRHRAGAFQPVRVSRQELAAIETAGWAVADANGAYRLTKTGEAAVVAAERPVEVRHV